MKLKCLFNISKFIQLLYLFCLALFFNLYCLKQQKNKTDLEYDQLNEQIYFTKTNLRARDSHDINGKIIKVLKTNTAVFCTSKTIKKYKIDELNNHWFKCKFNDKQGWLYGGYLSEHKTIDIKSNNYFVSLANDTHEMDMQLFKNGNFQISISKGLDYVKDAHWEGKWNFKNDILELNFEYGTGSDEILIFPKGIKSKNKEEFPKKVGNKKYLLKFEGRYIYLWLTPLELMKIED